MERLLICFYQTHYQAINLASALLERQYQGTIHPLTLAVGRNRSLQNPVNHERVLSDWSMQGFVVWN